MSLSKEILEESEFAKNQLLNSALDERCKKSLLRLLNVSTMATNGITVEEKIQKITETVHGLILSQITFLDAVDKKIDAANKAQCIECKAMKFANKAEEEEHKKKLIEEWKKANNIKDQVTTDKAVKNELWTTTIQSVLKRPGIWVFLTVLSVSPYGVDILKTLLQFWGAH